MSNGIASLHKILKDETRRKIVITLNERGSQTYTDLMNSQGITSTGKINYHIKMLDGLVAKNQDGLYSLTEKGKLAIRLIDEFCEKKNNTQEAFVPRGFYIFTGLFLTFLLNLFFGLYVIKMDLYVLFPYVFVFSGAVFLVMGERARRRKTMSRCENQMLGVKIIAIFAGVLAGWIIVYYTGNSLFGLWWIVASFVIGSILGGLIGYLVYKKSIQK
jgi:hypothetical protein